MKLERLPSALVLALGAVAHVFLLQGCGGDGAVIGPADPISVDRDPTVPDAPAKSPDAAVDASGSVDASTASCGATGCATNEVCSRGEFACGGPGTCAPRPSSCASGPIDLQCGCDNNTYVSACKAAAAGISIRHAGSCNVKNGQEVTCRTSEHCRATQYCHFIGDCGKSSKGLGLCKERPTTCAPPGNFASCGCDGATYASVCEAARAGVSTTGLAPCGT